MGLKDLVKETPKETSLEFLGDRLLLIQCLEAVRAQESGVLQRKRDAEVGAIFGLGFAPNTGGPFSYLDRVGLKTAVAKLQGLSEKYGERFTPPKLLAEMAQRGERFFDPV